MKLKLDIRLDNAAFEDEGPGNEAARILREAAEKLEAAQLEGRDLNSRGPLFNLRDVNGNQVGEVRVTR